MIAKLAILACLIAVSYTMAVPVEQEIAIQSNDTLMHLCKDFFFSTSLPRSLKQFQEFVANIFSDETIG
jgi:hypothetical protein